MEFNSYQNPGNSGGVLPTGGEVRSQIERQLQNNTNNLNDLLVSKDDSILGIKIPKSLMILARGFENFIKLEGISQSQKLFKGTVALVDKLPLLQNHSARIATAVEFLFRWGLITGTQSIKLGQAWGRRQEGYKNVLKEYRPVMASTGISSKTNGVIQEELKRVDERFWQDMKLLATEIPALAFMIAYGLQKQGEINVNKDKWLEEARASSRPPANAMDEADKVIANIKKDLERKNAIEAGLAGEKEEWIKKYRGVRINRKGDTLSDEQLERLFYREVVQPRLDNYTKVRAESQIAPKPEDSKILKYLSWGAQPVGELIRYNIEEAEPKEPVVSTGDKIRELARSVREGYGRDADYLAGEVLDIIHQYEKNHGYGGLGEAMRDQDSPVAKAAQVIAEHIANKRLTVESLVAILGEDKIIVHEGNQRRFADEQQLEKALAPLLPVMRVRENKKLEDILPDFDNPKLAEETIRKNLAGGLTGKEKALFASLFPDEVLKKEGLTNKQVMELLTEAHPIRTQWIMANAKRLDGLEESKIKELRLAESHIQAIHALVDTMNNGDMKEVEAVINSDKNLLAAIRIAGLNEQMKTVIGEGEHYWANRTKEAAKMPEEMAKMQQEAAPEEESSRGWRNKETARRFNRDPAELEQEEDGRGYNKRRGRQLSEDGEFASAFEKPSSSARERESGRRSRSYGEPYTGM